MINWQEVIQTVGGQAVLLAVLAYLFKSLVSSRLEKDADAFKAKLQHDYDLEKQRLKHNADVEIERLKNSLQIAALEHQVRFSKLHEKRTDFIPQLVREIEQAQSAVANYVIHNPSGQEQFTQAWNDLRALMMSIRNNRMLLPIEMCQLLDDFEARLTKIVMFVSVYWTRAGEYLNQKMREEQIRVITESVGALESDIPKLKAKLIEEFRLLMSGTIENSPKT